MNSHLAALIREKIAKRRKGFLAVSIDVDELERWATLAEQPPADLPDAIVVHLPEKEGDRG